MASPRNASAGDAAVVRIRFGAAAPPNARVLRTVDAPNPVAAWEEPASLADLDAPDADAVLVAFAAPGAALPTGLFAGKHVALSSKAATLRWKPGVAVVEGTIGAREDVLAALAEFAFLEGQLRSLEREMGEVESEFQQDLARCFRIRPQDCEHGERFASLTERCYGLWTKHARIASRLERPTPSLSPAGRKIMARLLARADVGTRSEEFEGRLEICGDLYEGATDRIADYRWYVGGHRLEMTIVVLLVVEVIFFAIELFFRVLEYHGE